MVMIGWRSGGIRMVAKCQIECLSHLGLLQMSPRRGSVRAVRRRRRLRLGGRLRHLSANGNRDRSAVDGSRWQSTALTCRCRAFTRALTALSWPLIAAARSGVEPAPTYAHVADRENQQQSVDQMIRVALCKVSTLQVVVINDSLAVRERWHSGNHCTSWCTISEVDLHAAENACLEHLHVAVARRVEEGRALRRVEAACHDGLAEHLLSSRRHLPETRQSRAAQRYSRGVQKPPRRQSHHQADRIHKTNSQRQLPWPARLACAPSPPPPPLLPRDASPAAPRVPPATSEWSGATVVINRTRAVGASRGWSVGGEGGLWKWGHTSAASLAVFCSRSATT